jgi:cytochrome P450
VNTISSQVAAARSNAVTGIRHPPGPKGLPVIGCLLPFLKNPMEAITAIAREYGGIARVPIRGRYLYVVSDPAMLKEMLVEHRQKYMKNVRYVHIQALLGQGLLLSEAAEWRRQRVITQPAFKPEAIDSQMGWMAAYTDKYLDRWSKLAAGGEIFDVEPEFGRLAQILSGRYLLGEPFDEIADEFCEIAAAVKAHWPLAPRNLVRAFMPLSKVKLARFEASIAALDEIVRRFITRHRANDFANCGVLTRIVMSSRAEGAEFDDKSLRDQISTLFFAGHETSATGLCWIHWALSRHPEIRAKLTQEVTGVIGDRLPTAADLHALTYTGQVIDESLRLHSPIHSISRVALVDNTIGGCHIPAGATVCVSMYAVHRLAHLWPDPEVFDPSRFEPEKVAQRSRFAYLPFASGHRNCIGAGQALLELKLIVARIAQRYTLDVAPGQKIEPAPGTTMYPRYGMKMRITPARVPA